MDLESKSDQVEQVDGLQIMKDAFVVQISCQSKSYIFMVKIARKKKGDAKSKVKRCDSLIRIGE